MVSAIIRRGVVALAALACGTLASAQFSQRITNFEVNGAGAAYPIQIASLGPLQVVMLQDPAESDTTNANVLGDGFAILSSGDPPLPSTEESFVAAFAGFAGANSSPQFLDMRFQWTTPADGNRWALVETLQSPQLGDPSIHLGGKIRIWVNLPNCAQFEYPGQVTLTPEIGLALLVAETGENIPLGFQDNSVLTGAYEFVGVASVAGADTANPVPVPSRFIPITDADCSGSSTGPAGDWRMVEFNLPTEGVIGWSFRGGNGVLDATGLGDGVNRGVLAGLVLTVRQTDTTSDYVEFLVDRIEFEAPVIDPPIAPTIAAPLVQGAGTVKVNNVVSRATNVSVEIDRSDANNEDPFEIDQTFDVAPGLDPNTEIRFRVVNVGPTLQIGDRVRARQTVGGVTGEYSLVVPVNPPAAFSATLSLDEDGNFGAAPADFEYVGATSVIPTAAPQGKLVFPQNGVWQKLEFSMIPGVEPVISFAGGNGQLTPDGGLYNIDAMFFSIDAANPSTGPYNIFLDHVYYIDANNNEQVIADSETSNPFPSRRGQSTSVDPGWNSIISGLASYDGVNANRLTWSFPDTTTSNVHAPFRPTNNFPDSAKAVGMWLLVEDERLSALPLPAIEQRVIGAAPAVTVNNIDASATNVTLLINGAASGSVNPAGAASVNITPTTPIVLGDSISAFYDAPGDAPSDVAFARVSQRPPPPSVQSALVAGQTSVMVSNVLNTGNAIASQVRLFDGQTLIGSANPAGQASVVISVNPALSVGQIISATQVVNAAESGPSAPVGVGTGERLRVVINEFQYDDEGADDREFIEIYNAESSPVDISGWVIRASDGTAPPGDPLADYTISNGVVLAPGDFYVLGTATVPNVDQVIGAANLFTDARAATELLDQNGVVVDTLITERNAGTLGIGDGEGHIWGNFQSQATNQSLQRWFDGFDTDDNGRDFGIRTRTPGATNNAPSLAPYTENFNGAADTDVPGWTGSFVRPKHINPTAVSTFNLNVIPASPQGGNAATVVDTSGGGNGGALDDAARFNVAFSCQVYINAENPGFVSTGTTGEYEAWSIGLGAVDQLHNQFHLAGNANANTGLVWQFITLEDANTGNVGSRTLQFVNRNNGGLDGVVLLDVPSSSLTNGWHTLTITRNYENVSASFDGHVYNGVIPDLGPGVLQVAYREFVVGFPSTLRPPTIDAVSVTVPAPPALGACCLDSGCQVVTAAVCAGFGGDYAGDGTICDDNTCAPALCPGDMNCDGTRNFSDIDPFVLALQGEGAYLVQFPDCFWLNGDTNGDNTVNFGDIDPFVALLGAGACP